MKNSGSIGRPPSPGKVTAQELARIPGASEFFQGVSDRVVEAAADAFEVVFVPGGRHIMRKGERGDSIFLIVHGRVRVSTPDPDGEEQTVMELGRGKSFGQIHLFTDEESFINVQTMRDSTLLRLSRTDFERLAPHHPDMLMRMSRRLISALRQVITSESVPRTLTTVAFLPMTSNRCMSESAAALVEALGGFESVAHLTAQRVEIALGPGAAQSTESDPINQNVIAWLHELEHQHRLVIYECDPSSTPWTRRSLRQADRILIAAEAGSKPDLRAVKGLLVDAGVDRSPVQRELLLMHDTGHALPTGTRYWLETGLFSRHHHVRKNHPADFRCVARRLTNRGVGLVLGGGGARGIAHVGVLKALEEANIPVDFVGGTSIGSIVGAAYARRWTPEFILDKVREVFGPKRALVDPTFPFVSLLSGRKLERILGSLFEGVEIEDLWIDFFCISASLSRPRMIVQDRGPLWKSIRASVSLPGIFPPVQKDKEVLIDGGIVNNLPMDVMSRRCDGGTVIAVDLGRGVIRGDSELHDTLSGWQLLVARINPFVESPRVPNILDVLIGTSQVNRSERQELLLSTGTADLLLTPPVQDFRVLDFDAYEELYKVGYEYARERLANWSVRVST
ncbi:MAG: cyclic nucleotide-binding and patatin-like phospholipase domain-containing protein [Nitrospiraceae bacterium]